MSKEREPTESVGSEHELSFYETVREYEHHFNNIEFEVRKLASVWLLAAFGAIAFVVRGDLESGSLLSSWSTLIVVAALANVGMLTLWILDQVVYHGLLDAVFTTALRIEQKHPSLPPVRATMMAISGGRGMARYLSLFYVIPMGVLASVAVAGFWRVLATGVSFRTGTVCGVVSALAIMTPVYVVWAWRSSLGRKADRTMKMAADFRALYDCPKGTGFWCLVARWHTGDGTKTAPEATRESREPAS